MATARRRHSSNTSTSLRTRPWISLLSLGACFVVAYLFHGHLIEWLSVPLPDDKKPITFGVTEPLVTSIKVSLWAGFALALPIILWQLWSFFAPAIEEPRPAHRRPVRRDLTFLFACGLAFGYWVASYPRCAS